MNDYRIEKDFLGEVQVPKNAYWGAQTQRAIDNFPVSGLAFPPVFIHSLGAIKQACASVNLEIHLLDSRLAGAIIHSCEEVREGRFNDQFPVDVFQTGSGTSTNMNANEVIATRANEILTGVKNTSTPVHPNNHVNMGQSSNDVIPTAIHVSACILVQELLLPAMGVLHRTITDQQTRYGAVGSPD
jgi:fumarate hydratase class II